MLDQMSRGRLEFGVGKGISPIESGYYGLDPANSEKMFAEAYELLMRSFATERLTYEGEFYQFRDVPLELQPYQKPHPPMWYGANNPDSAARAAKRGMNVVGNVGAKIVRGIAEKFWPAVMNNPSPKVGMNRHIVIAENGEEALAIARRAYKQWHNSFMKLWRDHNLPPIGVAYPPEIDGFIENGMAAIGTPDYVRDLLQGQLDESGANYLGCRFAFGDLTFAESARTVDLFAREVMPHLRAQTRIAAE